MAETTNPEAKLTKSPEKPSPVDIGVLQYPGAQLSAVHGLTDLFLTANRIAERIGSPQGRGPAALRVSHWHLTEGSGAVDCCYASGEGVPVQLACFILPPSLETRPGESPPMALRAWLTAQHDGGAVACSVCAGAFLLAQAGLLNGRGATTHWALHDDFAALFPEVGLETEKLIVEDGDVITAGGVMAWVDLGLRIVDRFLGPSAMLEVARFFLVDPGGREQRFYSTFAPRLRHGDEAVLKAQHWLHKSYQDAVSLAAMAAAAGLSERTFLRRFHKATGLNPTAYLQRLRVGKARELLELSSLPFGRIAWEVGYEDPAAFRKVFHKVMGLTPGDYRRRFAVR